MYCEVMFSEEISGELPEHNRFIHETAIPYFEHAIVFPTAMPQREVLARLPAEIVIATAEQHTPGISQAPYLRKTAMAVSVEFCGRFSLPMPDTAAAVLDGMDTHIPPGEERKTLEEIRELSVTIGDTVEKALGLQRGQSAPQRDEAR